MAHLTQTNSGGEDFSYEDFVRSRKLHWMLEAKKLGTLVEVPPFGAIPLEEDDSNFFVSAKGPGNVHAIFEDSADTGWFYIYDADLRRIVNATHVYNRGQLTISADEIDLAWSKNNDICSVAIWEQIRAFLGVNPEISMRKPVRDRDSAGFSVDEWPEGFSYLLKADEK